ncbi:Protein-tyrosine phosphatase, low molecular weight, mammalian [Penicillium digitatum]|uniref:Protein-tyrosine phosphatase, low molecular weight, mammalian n=1 Tax=Penicillium digitatum TaxID=36651 RepID=A0A7T7BQ54_PENDI|nr:Protein-tyrosine phosphatase, low molecular weight, mammalian [Penicillium digitatum]
MASNSNARPAKVLFVCLGNICRSPMAEGVFRHIAGAHPSIGEIDSAGTAAYHCLEPPDSRTMSTLRRHEITDYEHAARKVTREDFLTFDYLLAMDKSNLRDLQELEERAVADVRLFGDFGKGGKVQDHIGSGEVVKDPYYGGANGFEEVYQQVVRFSQNFVEFLEQNPH